MTYAAVIHAEAFAWHRELIEHHRDRYDPIVLDARSDSHEITYWEYLDAQQDRHRLVGAAHDRVLAYHAIVMPSVAIAPPPLRTLENSRETELIEYLIGRNNEVANYFGFCACTVPCHYPGESPVGFLVMGPSRTDRRTLAIAKAMETALR